MTINLNIAANKNKIIYLNTITALNSYKLGRINERISDALFRYNRNIYDNEFIKEWNQIKNFILNEIYNHFNDTSIMIRDNYNKRNKYSMFKIMVEFIEVNLTNYPILQHAPSISFDSIISQKSNLYYSSDRLIFQIRYKMMAEIELVKCATLYESIL